MKGTAKNRFSINTQYWGRIAEVSIDKCNILSLLFMICDMFTSDYRHLENRTSMTNTDDKEAQETKSTKPMDETEVQDQDPANTPEEQIKVIFN